MGQETQTEMRFSAGLVLAGLVALVACEPCEKAQRTVDKLCGSLGQKTVACVGSKKELDLRCALQTELGEIVGSVGYTYMPSNISYKERLPSDTGFGPSACVVLWPVLFHSSTELEGSCGVRRTLSTTAILRSVINIFRGCLVA